MPGGWGTPKQYSSLAEARRELALLPEFKSNPAGLVVREYTVIQAAPVRQGKVGALIGQDGKTYQGGGDQIEFLFERDTKQDPKWKIYLDDQPETYTLSE